MSVLLTENLAGGVRLLTLNRPRMHAFNVELMQALSQAMNAAAADGAVRAIVIRGAGAVFSAGLDFEALFAARDAGQTQAFSDAMQQCFLDVWRCPKPTVAAVTGHAIAAGFFVAVACDFRHVVEGAGQYGINELQFGAGFPSIAVEIGRWALQRDLAYAIQSAELFDWRAGLRNGSFHASHADADQLLAAAVTRAASLGARPQAGYAHVKAQLIAPYVQRVLDETAEQRNRGLAIFESEETVQSMQKHAAAVAVRKGGR
ncbi:MAG TPA: enoyl-CoA hydratase/isomerase family protein [Solimonas sp.]|nr:enoyl-CoA hydratase/isomerase family protein [Solimonas sp.]